MATASAPFSPNSANARPTRVALLGFGTVGSAVAKLLRAQKFPGIELTHIYNRNVDRKRTGDTAKKLAPSIRWTENIDEVLNNPGIDVIIETIGGLSPMEQWLKTALTAGKHVVTARVACSGDAVGANGPATRAGARANWRNRSAWATARVHPWTRRCGR